MFDCTIFVLAFGAPSHQIQISVVHPLSTSTRPSSNPHHSCVPIFIPNAPYHLAPLLTLLSVPAYPKIERASHTSLLTSSYRIHSIAAAPRAVAAAAIGGREERHAAAGLEALAGAGGDELPAVRAVVWVRCEQKAGREEWTNQCLIGYMRHDKYVLHHAPQLEIHWGVVDEGRERKAAVHSNKVLVAGVHQRRGLDDLVHDVHGLPAVGVVVWRDG